MNKLLIAVFDSETAAQAGLRTLHKLHTQGDITVYATGVIAKDADGQVSLKQFMDADPVGTGMGLAVDSLIGLLGSPVGRTVGAVRDFWVAGVDLDFIEAAQMLLLPGKAALLAEIEEEWVSPIDAALEAAGGQILRRTRAEVAEDQFDHDIVTFKAETKEIDSEVSHVGGSRKEKLHTKIAVAKVNLDADVQRVDALKQEADASIEAVKFQMKYAKGDMKTLTEDWVKQVKGACHARGA